MSDMELEKAAMGPRRWIQLCGAFNKHRHNNPDARLWPRASRIINYSSATEVNDLFIVPGGRYLLSFSPDSITVWDLWYTSSANYKIIASVEPEGRCGPCIVQPTPDGTGLTILSSKREE